MSCLLDSNKIMMCHGLGKRLILKNWIDGTCHEFEN